MGEKDMECAGCRGKVADFKSVSITADKRWRNSPPPKAKGASSSTVNVDKQEGRDAVVLRIDNKGQTMRHAFVEVENENDGRRGEVVELISLCRDSLFNGKRARGVMVTSSQGELMDALFPSWLGCFNGSRPSLAGIDNNCVIIALESGVMTESDVASLLYLICLPDLPFKSSLHALSKGRMKMTMERTHPIPLIRQLGLRSDCKAKSYNHQLLQQGTCSSIFRISDHSSASSHSDSADPIDVDVEDEDGENDAGSDISLSDDSRACSDSELRTLSSATAASSTTSSAVSILTILLLLLSSAQDHMLDDLALRVWSRGTVG
ncbi:hypothetical protein BT96DRAFT_951395 [Gymnopus androsaceus JB14]|uniref:Uncharacterized protein n=1 Tax=Gymnopus androsaceus JB14 TaxID=1447944 RepID=A0A6A4GD82_9AGAR|nr:hypothetical protein BT96DRAFT_951395 [Gymnopus androsaceus JB14]